MCEWCDKDKIKDIIYENGDADWKAEPYWNKYNTIVHDKLNDSYGLWVECEDWYYSGIEFYNIEFCPYCGRKLK